MKQCGPDSRLEKLALPIMNCGLSYQYLHRNYQRVVELESSTYV
jgi:hypothetical protein